MDQKQILAGVESYCRAIHTQREEDFLIGRIQKAYSRIDLISEAVEVRFAEEDTAVVTFAYSTDCIRRDTGEPHGISGLETQIWTRIGGEWKLTTCITPRDRL